MEEDNYDIRTSDAVLKESEKIGGNIPYEWHVRLLSMFHREKRRAGRVGPSLFDECVAEAFGVMFVIIFGVGSVNAAVLTEYHNDALWNVAVLWGIGATLAISTTASISGAHINPAVSTALAIFRPHKIGFLKMLAYWLAQYTGGIIGAAFNYMIWGGLLANYEANEGITRGSPESVLSAMVFGEYFPNPHFERSGHIPKEIGTAGMAFFVEAWGTAILMFVVLAVLDPNQKMVAEKAAPVLIGFTVAALITLYAPWTMAAWNPARDLGPRIVAACAGWGRVAFPGPRNGFWVYILGPHVGAIVGAFVYDLFLYPAYSSLA